MTTGLRQHQEILNQRIINLTNALCENFAKQYGNDKYYHPDCLTYEVVSGTKYYKVVMLQGGSRSVHAFIHKQSGTVYKPANWKSPAKHVRYNLLDDVSYEQCLKNADWAGGYLYMW